MRLLIGILIALSLGAVWAVAQDRSSDYDKRYGVLSDRNMFLKDRPRPRQMTTRPATTQRVETPPETPEMRYVLRGVIIEEDEFHAYFEDRRGGMSRVAPGDELANGRIAQIDINAVAFEKDGAVTWIEIGQNLTGSRVATTPVTESTTAPASGTAEGSTPAAPGSALERMRLRRLQEQGGQK